MRAQADFPATRYNRPYVSRGGVATPPGGARRPQRGVPSTYVETAFSFILRITMALMLVPFCLILPSAYYVIKDVVTNQYLSRCCSLTEDQSRQLQSVYSEGSSLPTINETNCLEYLSHCVLYANERVECLKMRGRYDSNVFSLVEPRDSFTVYKRKQGPGRIICKNIGFSWGMVAVVCFAYGVLLAIYCFSIGDMLYVPFFGTLGGDSMDTPRAPRFTFIDGVNFLGAVMMSLCMSGFSTYALWYNTMSDPLLKGCCELSDNQYRMLRGKYLNNMTLLKLNQTWFLERLPDCVIVINSTQQLAPQRCCNERHLLSLTMPSDAFKIYERPLNCGHVACKNISNRFKMGFYTFLLFCVAHWLAYSNVKTAYTYPRRVAEIRRVQARMAARERREVAQTQTMPAAGQ